MFSTGFISLSVLLLFLYRSPSSSLCTVFYSISSNIDEVLSSSPSANAFVFGDFNVHIRTSLAILVKLIELVNSVIIFLSPTRIPDCDSYSPALLDFFLSSDPSICSTMAFPPLENSDHVVVSVSIDFLSS